MLLAAGIGLVAALALAVLGTSAENNPAGGGSASSHGVEPTVDRSVVARHISEAGTPQARQQPPKWVSTHERVLQGEALPCTTPNEPINFDIFSAGRAVKGLPLTSTVRRCDAGADGDESPANYLAYVYGNCDPSQSGCSPPLQIHSWHACQRAYTDYSFEGQPLPYRELADMGDAKVVEIDFLVDRRIEIYTGSSTIVIWAADRALALAAVEMLRSQPSGRIPITDAADLAGEPGELDPPADGAIEGELRCAV